jgi:hypothetical protein
LLDRFFANTANNFGSEDIISKYIRNQENQEIEKNIKSYNASELIYLGGIDALRLCYGEIHFK